MNVSGARQRVVAEFGGGLLVVERRIVVLDRDGVLANLLAPDLVVVGIADSASRQISGDNDTASEPT